MQIPYFTFQYNVALDLGTAWTRAASPEGRHSSIRSERRGTRGIQAGAVASVSTCAEILHDIFESIRPRFLSKPRVVASVSSCATETERQLLTDTLRRAGAWSVTLIPQPLVAALGAGLDPGSDYAQMIVDVGDGFTEYAIVRSGRVEMSRVVKAGCGTVRNAAAHYYRRSGDGGNSSEQAEEILRRMAAMEPAKPGETALSALPPALVRELEGPLNFLADGSLRLFQKLPDRLACEVIENGIILVGGGALLQELKSRMAARTGLAVRVPGNPLTAAIEGATQVIPYAARASRCQVA